LGITPAPFSPSSWDTGSRETKEKDETSAARPAFPCRSRGTGLDQNTRRSSVANFQVPSGGTRARRSAPLAWTFLCVVLDLTMWPLAKLALRGHHDLF
jgi:hypothetical protein